jgi:hypothetical protein
LPFTTAAGHGEERVHHGGSAQGHPKKGRKWKDLSN